MNILGKTLLVLTAVLFLSGCTPQPDQKELPDTSEQTSQPSAPTQASPSPQLSETSQTKIDPTQDLCAQISAEFVTQITGITIDHASVINDVSINACDYYLSSEKNSAYIAIIVNKNLNFEKHKQIAQKNKFVLTTDSSIKIDHYLAWADNQTRIVNINLKLDENSFLRIDKNVERTIDNDGLLRLARAVATRL